jgi:hypothetical protein
MVGFSSVAVQHVAGDNVPVRARDGREFGGARARRVAGCVHRGVGDALKVLVDHDAVLVSLDADPLQAKVVDLGDAACAMDNEVRVNRP